MKTEIATINKSINGVTIPSDWDISSIYNLVDILGGGTPSTQNIDYWNGNIPWLSVTDFNNGHRRVFDTEKKITEKGLSESNTQILKMGQVIISARGTVGVIAQVGRDMAFNQSCYGIIGKNGISNDFVYYLLKNYISDFKQKSHGAVFDTITRDTFKNIEVAIPTERERDQISEILSSLDDKIELNRKINFNLEKLGSFLFKEWFIDVDNQQIGKVSDLIRVESGFPFHSSMFDENGDYKLVTIKNVQDGFFVPECTDSLSEIPSKVPTHCRLNNGDILLSLTGNVGRVCFVYGENYLLNQRVANLVPIDENNRAFTYFLFRQKDFQNTLIGISRGTAQQNLSPIETKSLEIPIPSQDMLDRFADVANPIFQKLVENYNEIKNLSTLRDLLLPRLMNGKIRVK
jgi:type I restriction enzyme S subunit